MINRSIKLDENVDWVEFKKIIGFVSESIVSYDIKENWINLEMKESADIDVIIEQIVDLSHKYIANKNLHKDIFYNNANITQYHTQVEDIFYFDDGMISLSNKALFLYEFFNDRFLNMVYSEFKGECDIVEKLYPVLLPISAYKKTGYLKRTPQYAMFCCSVCENMNVLNELDKRMENNYKDIIRNPEYALSPSACFHVYEEYKNATLPNNTIITFTQSVFRNEGRFNFSEYGRMRDYHVREIVFIGDDLFVENSRERMIKASEELIKEMNINATITIAADPFILPKMQKYKKIQMIDKSKYELRMTYDKKNDMSVASFNLHGTAFTSPFNISVMNKKTVTGCIGYGLERFVLAFLAQYGDNIDKWPAMVRNEYEKKA